MGAVNVLKVILLTVVNYFTTGSENNTRIYTLIMLVFMIKAQTFWPKGAI
jgi:hypothetical protein